MNEFSNPPVSSYQSNPVPQTSMPPRQLWKATLVWPVVFVLSLLVVAVIAYTFGKRQTQPADLSVVDDNSISSESMAQIEEYTESEISDPTADWQVYRDEQVGITFKYPPTWTAQRWKLEPFNIFLDDHAFEIPENTEFSSPVQVRLNNDPETGTTLAGQSTYLKSSFLGEDVAEENLTVGGKQAVKLSGKAGPGMFEGNDYVFTVVQLDNKVLSISLSNSPQFQEIYDLMLTTLEFSE